MRPLRCATIARPAEPLPESARRPRARAPFRCRGSEGREHSGTADGDFPKIPDDVDGDQETGDHAIITVRASSSEMAWRSPSTSIVTGPSERRLFNDAETNAGANSDLAEVAQNLRHLLGDAGDRDVFAGLDLRERNADPHGLG